MCGEERQEKGDAACGAKGEAWFCARLLSCPNGRGGGLGLGRGPKPSSAPQLAGAHRKSQGLIKLRNNLSPPALPLENKQTKSPGGISLQGQKNGLFKCIFSLKLGAGVGRCDLIVVETALCSQLAQDTLLSSPWISPVVSQNLPPAWGAVCGHGV